MAENAGNKGRDRIGKVLYYIYFIFLICTVVLIAQIINVQFFFKPDPAVTKELTPSDTKTIIQPARGAILAKDGRLLAMSFPSYSIAIDPSVLKEEFSKDPEKGKQKEQEWMDKALALSKALPAFFPEKTADEYYEMIRRDRAANRRYRTIGHPVDNSTLNQIKELPLFNEGKYKGGLIVEQENVRQYPYGKLARRTIGFIRTNTYASTNTHIGLEGKFDYVLHGQEGVEWKKITDRKRRVQDYDSVYVKPVDGLDIRTTIDIELQDLADRALREQIEPEMGIEGGCLVVMEVPTGAVRAMVNLKRDSSTGLMEEHQNFAIGRTGEPGSVFKSTTLMTAIEDGYVKTLDDKIPTNRGFIKGFPVDDHITDYERNNGVKEIPIIDGFEMSSNYVFRYIAITNYGDNPQKLLDRLYSYKLGEAFDFDLSGMATPRIPSPKSESWSNTDLGSVAIGYSVAETPLHILTFYNAIANKGKMMKPYLVESIEKGGIVKEKRGPSILNAAICSKATADTLTRALKAVTKEGTATRLKNAKCSVAGKTGTARIILDSLDSPKYAGKYEDDLGRKKNQATFVGFFPAESPQYSVICTVYSTLSRTSFYGGTLPALAVRTIVDGLYAMDPAWRPNLEQKGGVPVMKADGIIAQTVAEELSEEPVKVPDVKGMGLKDAIYTLENAGFRCSYTGVGHVKSQTPAAGSRPKNDEPVKIVLK